MGVTLYCFVAAGHAGDTMPLTLLLADEHATEQFGRQLAASWLTMGALGSAAVLYLYGELGAGKTTLVRGLLHAVGVRGRVRSPTYTLVDIYELPNLTCVHVDLYRLRSSSEVDELALREMLVPGTMMLIEWPENGGTLVPTADLELRLSHAGDAREVRATPSSALGGRWLHLVQ